MSTQIGLVREIELPLIHGPRGDQDIFFCCDASWLLADKQGCHAVLSAESAQ